MSNHREEMCCDVERECDENAKREERPRTWSNES